MNYEVFIWLEPVASSLEVIGLVAGCLGFGVATLLYAYYSYCLNDTRAYKGKEGSDWRYKDAVCLAEQLAPLAKKILIISIVSLLVGLVSRPLANFTDIYKKTLIYRGINSTLADKSIDTAEKALDLLNKKIDVEMEKMNPAAVEKE